MCVGFVSSANFQHFMKFMISRYFLLEYFQRNKHLSEVDCQKGVCTRVFQIPSILNHHKVFLEELRKKLDTWELKQTIGDVFLDVVRFPVKHLVVLFNENIHLSFHFLQLKLLFICVPSQSVKG